jgi:hypothetical protein
MAGKNRIMIYGPKDDGTYVVEFRTARATFWPFQSRGVRRIWSDSPAAVPCRQRPLTGV